jgi:peptide/nickel transport system substrate-binding protein/oligopeptide transport system substrate-binding protein
MDVYWLGFNLNREPYSNNYLLRRALNYAIDREAIIKNIMGEGYLPARSIIPAGIEGYNRDICGYSYDQAKAKKLLADAGYPGGQGLPTLTLTYNEGTGHQQMMAEVARQLGEIGVVVETQVKDWEDYKKQLNHRSMSFFRLGWEADYPDADNYLYSLFQSSQIGISNLTGYRNAQVDKILDASRAEYRSSKERIKLLQRAEQIILDDAPCIFLFQKKASILVGQGAHGLQIDPTGAIDWYRVELRSSGGLAADTQ